MQSRACKMLDFSVPIDPPVHGTLPSLTLSTSTSRGSCRREKDDDDEEDDAEDDRDGQRRLLA